MTGKVIVGIASLAAFVGYCFWRGQSARAAKTGVKEDLHRWEDEGGNVPAVATPSPTPSSSYPGAASSARH